MGNKYYKRLSDKKEFVHYKDISNGRILTIFDPKTGTPICNGSYQLFVLGEELANNFVAIDFKLEAGEQIDSIIVKHLSDFMYQFQNYGVAENQSNAFDEFVNSANFKHNVFREMVKQNKDAEFKHFLASDDDEFEFGDAEDLFNMVCGGFIPIMKKMLIEYGESLK